MLLIGNGLINTHMHIYSAFARGMGTKGPGVKNFIDILENLWWKLDKALTLEDIKYSAYITYIDSIKKGTYGDVIIVDYDPLTLLNETNINSHIIFGMMGRSVTHTIINRKVLMKDRELQGIDEKQIFAKSRELASKLWNRI